MAGEWIVWRVYDHWCGVHNGWSVLTTTAVDYKSAENLQNCHSIVVSEWEVAGWWRAARELPQMADLVVEGGGGQFDIADMASTRDSTTSICDEVVAHYVPRFPPDNDRQLISNSEQGISRVDPLPFEIIRMIFFECDAPTRCNMAAMNRRAAAELSSWTDVRHVYITRSSARNEDHRTVIVQAYRLVTNCKALGIVETPRVIPMLFNLRNLTTMLIESSPQRILDRYNRLTEEEGFFALLRNLEVVKVCSIYDNLGVTCNLSDFLSLPKLRILHIREYACQLVAPPEEEIVAPIEDLRLCTHRMNTSHVVSVCRALSKTLTRLELLVSFLTPDSWIAFAFRSMGSLNAFRAMTSVERLTHLTVARLFIRPSIIDEVFSALQSMRSLRKISFELLDLQDISRLANLYLPPQCNHVAVNDAVRIGLMWFSVSAAEAEFFSVFNGDDFDMLRRECANVSRELILQFGRLRGFDGPTVRFAVGNVEVWGNSIGAGRSSPFDGRVFLYGDQVLSRCDYLNIHGITLPQSSNLHR